MVKIRLMRMGAKKRPFYRVVVADSRSPRDGRFIENIGKYHPLQHPSLIDIDEERALHWLRTGAQPSEPVRNLLVKTGVWEKFSGEAPPPPKPEKPARPKQAEQLEEAAQPVQAAPAPESAEATPEAQAPEAQAPEAEAPETETAEGAEETSGGEGADAAEAPTPEGTESTEGP